MTDRDPCYRCDHPRREHDDDGCTGIWNGHPCPCPVFDDGDHWAQLTTPTPNGQT